MKMLARLFGGHKQKSDELDKDIAVQQATLRQNAQVVQSGARVIENISGAMRVIMELEREKTSR